VINNFFYEDYAVALDIFIVQDDLIKRQDPWIESIASDTSENLFYHNVQKIASGLGLLFIRTIDPYGVTLVNKQQLSPLEEEIKIVRRQPGANQHMLDILQGAIEEARKRSGYILFSGD
jgi:hypothetical protein